MTQVILPTEGRYDRQELISWWDQERLRSAGVLVVGAGALGNEIVKDLVLLGVGRVAMIDMDVVERSNLARCVLFRERDEGRPKAEAAAERARELNSEVMVEACVADVRSVGLGWLRRFDLVIGGLDNREARVWVNRACRKLGKPWVDGAIEGLRGVVRVFLSTGPCYECTLGEADRAILELRRSCSLLPVEDAGGKIPTTATSASVIAALQVQEAVKLLHGDDDLVALAGRGLMFVGETMETWPVVYSADPDCPAHDRYEALVPWGSPQGVKAADLFAHAHATLGPGLVADLEDGVVAALRCVSCRYADLAPRRLLDLGRGDASCPRCSAELQLDVRLSIDEDDELATVPLAELGRPDHDVVSVRSAKQRVHYVMEPAS